MDCTTNHDHKDILNWAIGASEYQLYNLINILSERYDIICYNNKNNESSIDNVLYKNRSSILNDDLDKYKTIIIQRFFPNIYSPKYNKI